MTCGFEVSGTAEAFEWVGSAGILGATCTMSSINIRNTCHRKGNSYTACQVTDIEHPAFSLMSIFSLHLQDDAAQTAFQFCIDSSLAMNTLLKLIRSDLGAIVTTELVMVAAVGLVGLAVTFSSVRDSVVSELSDVGGAVQDVNQSVTYYGTRGASSATGGTDFIDTTDECDDNDDVSGAADNGIVFDTPPEQEFGIRDPSFAGIAKGSTLSGSSQNFSWSSNGTIGIDYWWIYAGSGTGSANYYNSGASLGTSTSTTITGLPTDGSQVFVRLWYRENGGWRWLDCQFTAAGP